jgi:ubiquinone/menaquinone biosynthesis C-methylase UbiE
MSLFLPPEDEFKPDSAGRLRQIPVQALLACLPLRKGMRFVDVGCGTGSYFFPVFQKLGGEGVFVAVELQEEMLRRFLARLEGYAEQPGFMHIEVARAKPDRLPLPDSSADLILLADSYHEIPRRGQYLFELRRVLSHGGTLCLVDWRTEGQPAGEAQADGPGPPMSERVSERQALDELEKAGFHWVVSHSGFPLHWCLCARK